MIHARRDVTRLAEPVRQVIGQGTTTKVTDVRRLSPIVLLPIGCYLVGFSFIRHKTHIFTCDYLYIMCVCVFLVFFLIAKT